MKVRTRVTARTAGTRPLALLLALLLVVTACSTGSDGGPADDGLAAGSGAGQAGADDPVGGVEAPDEDWVVEVAFSNDTKLGGCAVGELDPGSPGGEIVTVAGDGQVWLTARVDGAWSSSSIAQLPGEAIGCVAADLLPEIPGDEIVTVGVTAGGEESGSPGVAHLLSRGADGWTTEVLLEDDALLHGVAVGDMDKDGVLDVVVAGYTRRVTVLGRDPSDSGWRTLGTGMLPDAAKSVVVLDPLGDRAGLAVVGCRDGSLIEFRLAEGGELARVDWAPGSSSQARLGALSPGVLVASDGGTLTFVKGDTRGPEFYASGDKLRGAMVADVDPGVGASRQACTAGYDGAIVVTGITSGESRVVARDDDRLHHLAVGQLHPEGPPSLVACGYSGRVIVVTHR